MIYLATPYTHPSKAWMSHRADVAATVASRFIAVGIHTFSPIAHTHPIAVKGDLPRGWEFWDQYDRWFIERCDVVVVVRMPGWDESKGVEAEIKLAHEYGKPVVYVDPGEQMVDQYLAQVLVG